MSGPGYEVVRINELESLPTTTGHVFRPLRRRLGIGAFGVNCWTGVNAGDDVIERHTEPNGPEELYVVVQGHARFTLGEETVDAPLGTVVSAPPGTLREAVAVDAGTTVMAIGGPVGEPYRPLEWEDFYVAFAYRSLGDVPRARAIVEEMLAAHPDSWRSHYNAACFEALEGEHDAALAHLRRATALNADDVRSYAAKDADFDGLRNDPRFAEALA